MKNMYIFISLLLIFSVSISGCIGKRYDKTEKIEYKINPTGKTKLVIENVKGKISVTKGDSTTGLQITAEIFTKVKKRELNKPLTDVIELSIDTTGNIIYINSESKSSNINFSFGKSSSPRVNYTIKIPEYMKLEIENVSGNVEVSDLYGNVSINVINGDLTCTRLYGNNRLEVVNGSIDVTLDSTKGMEIDAVNGNIELNLTDNFKGQVKASSVNGKIRTDEKLKFENVTSDRQSFKGVIGNADTDVKVEVVNGKVTIYKKQ